MRMREAILSIASFAVVLGMAPAARAERPAGPCREDVQKFCPDARRGGGAFRDCLEQHATELSPTCQEHLRQVKSKVEAWRQACQDDVQMHCAGVQPGGGNLFRCLRQHQDQLSKSCQEQMAQAPRKRHRNLGPGMQPPTPPSPE